MADRFGVEVAGGITLAAERWTGEGPPVALLHAGVCDRRSWTDVAPALAPADVVAYDRRGFGETPAGSTAFRHLDDLITVLDVAFPGTPVWLVGNSMGGALARTLARDMPATRTHVFAGAAHLPSLERPDEVARVIASAL